MCDLHNSLETRECTRPRLGLSWLEKAKNIAKEVLVIAAFMPWPGCLTPSSSSPTSLSKASALLEVCFALGSRGCASTDCFWGVGNSKGLDWKPQCMGWSPVPAQGTGLEEGLCVCLCVSTPSKPSMRHNPGLAASRRELRWRLMLYSLCAIGKRAVDICMSPLLLLSKPWEMPFGPSVLHFE